MKNAMPNMKKQKTDYKVPNLEKGLAILDFLSHNVKGKTLQEIKDDIKISQTTAYRILNAMTRLDYLIYDDDTKKYRLSRKLLTLGFRALNEHQLLETVLPHLRELRDRVKETACFGVLGEKKGIFIEQAQGSYAFSFKLSPGKSFELHCSAPGKAIMAFLPNSVRENYLSYMDFQKFNEKTIVSKNDYLQELETVFSKGYALDNEEELSGVICIAAPIFNYNGYPCGAIWISGPKGRLVDETINIDANIIKETAERISSELGYVKVKH